MGFFQELELPKAQQSWMKFYLRTIYLIYYCTSVGKVKFSAKEIINMHPRIPCNKMEREHTGIILKSNCFWYQCREGQWKYFSSHVFGMTVQEENAKAVTAVMGSEKYIEKRNHCHCISQASKIHFYWYLTITMKFYHRSQHPYHKYEHHSENNFVHSFLCESNSASSCHSLIS